MNSFTSWHYWFISSDCSFLFLFVPLVFLSSFLAYVGWTFKIHQFVYDVLHPLSRNSFGEKSECPLWLNLGKWLSHVPRTWIQVLCPWAIQDQNWATSLNDGLVAPTDLIKCNCLSSMKSFFNIKLVLIRFEKKKRDCMSFFFNAVVDTYAAWCGPCKAIVSSFKRLKNELGDDLLVFATVSHLWAAM